MMAYGVILDDNDQKSKMKSEIISDFISNNHTYIHSK